MNLLVLPLVLVLSTPLFLFLLVRGFSKDAGLHEKGANNGLNFLGFGTLLLEKEFGLAKGTRSNITSRSSTTATKRQNLPLSLRNKECRTEQENMTKDSQLQQRRLPACP